MILPIDGGHHQNVIRYDEVHHGKVDNNNEKNHTPVIQMPTGNKR